MICVRTPFEDEGVDESAVEPHPNPDPRLCVVGLLGGHQIVELAVEVRHRQHRQNPRDGLVLGLLAGSGHTAGLADGTDERPKKNPAVMSSSDAAYAHQIGTASASEPRT